MNNEIEIVSMVFVGLFFCGFLLFLPQIRRMNSMMSEEEIEEISNCSFLWTAIGSVLSIAGYFLLKKSDPSFFGVGVVYVVGPPILLFSLLGLICGLLRRDNNAGVGTLIGALLFAFLMPLFAIVLAGYALSSPANRMVGIGLIAVGLMGLVFNLLLLLAL